MSAIVTTSRQDAEAILRALTNCASKAREGGSREHAKAIEQALLAIDGALGATSQGYKVPQYIEPCEICGKNTMDPECDICGDMPLHDIIK